MFFTAFTFDVSLWAELEIRSESGLQRFFADWERKVSVCFHNAGDQNCSSEICTKLIQVSSSTAVVLYERTWKRLEVLSGQTIKEAVPVNFPAVDAETRFLIQWLEGTNRVIGKTDVLVYPTNLLDELKPLLGEENLGVLDPNEKLKPTLKQNHVDFLDLGEISLEDFHGKLAILGPFESKAQIREGLKQSVQKIAGQGVAVVWIQPPSAPKDDLKPSFYVLPEGKCAVVVVQSELVAGLTENPRSQLNLIYFSKLALNPEPFPLPDLKAQP